MPQESVIMRSVSPERLADEVARRLSFADSVIIPTKGMSMRPFIIGGEERVELVRPGRVLSEGMIVLARTEKNGIVLHRIVGFHGNSLTLMGDGNLSQRETCSISDVVGIAIYIIRCDGRKKYLYTERRLQMWKLWYRCLPFRRWLLRLL